MHLGRLKIQNLRVLAGVDVHPNPSINVVFGDNGSGKTSLLEAIYLLGQGRSFRSRLARDVIRREETQLLVYAELFASDGRRESLGVEKSVSESRYRCSGKDIHSASALARLLPTLLVTPDSQRLLTDGGRLRRRMLDWALFHVEPVYHGVLQSYRQSLRQRNAQLRQNPQKQALDAWGSQLSQAAHEVHRYRQAFSLAVSGPLNELISELMSREITVRYKPGWNTEVELSEVLEANMETDRSRGFTAAGPHRADIQFLVEGRPAQNVLSRGEAKLFVAAVLLAHTKHISLRSREQPVVLVDDLASELDHKNREGLLEVLRRCQTQVFLTATDKAALALNESDNSSMFHVEQGQLTEVV